LGVLVKYKILLVDDDKDNLESTKMLLELHGYEVKTINGGRQAIDLIQKGRSEFALILMDYHMPNMNGAEVIFEIKKIKPQQQILSYTMDGSKETAVENFRAGANDYIEKNADNDVLLKKVKSYCEKFEAVFRTISSESLSEDESLKRNSEFGFIGHSAALNKVIKEIELYSQVNSTVLIQGETGSGKELIAQALHKMSQRSQGRFVAVNCGAIPQGLVESTLFGHLKGSFTGALVDQDGKFKLANGGTIFLDEIGELPLDVQAKLLRVLQERVIDPVGSRISTKIDVRVIAATHRDLDKMVKEGKFREDLLYRLNTLIVKNPPLRERTEDIEPLVEYFSRKVSEKNGVHKRFQRAVLKHLERYPWPGNVRELENMVESHLLRSADGVVSVEQLDSKFFTKSEDMESIKTLKEMEESLETVKLKFIMDVIGSSGSKAEAAKKLDISASNLQYFLSKMIKLKETAGTSLQ
jgi:DNA-binding NtrC family response regulator